MRFSAEELDFFSNIFTDTSSDVLADEGNDVLPNEKGGTLEVNHKLSVKTEVPPYLRQVLVDSKLTLLAEISHYQLWFPVTLSFSEGGDFIPKLGTPEIIDVQGNERSWRVNTPKDVAIIDAENGQNIEVLSLSTTGIVLKVVNSSDSVDANAGFSSDEKSDIDIHGSSFKMSLAGGEPMKLELDLVRHEKNIVAAKFKDLQQGRESLRQFLFNSHKMKYSNLYEDVIL